MRNKRVMIAVGAFMTVLVGLLLLRAHALAADPFERFSQFMAAHPNVKVAFSLGSKDKAGPTGTLLFQKPARTLYKVSFRATQYSASSTEEGYRELDAGTETYDEYPSNHRLGVRPSRISGAVGSAPGFVLSPDLHKVIPPKPTITKKGDEDEIYGKAQSQQGVVEIWADVDPRGKLTSFRVKQQGAGGMIDQTWTLSYEFPAKLTLNDFLTPIPLGYSPFALPPAEIPLQKGKAAPVAGWHRGGSTVNLLDEAHQKPFLLAILDSEAPSQSALVSVKSLKEKMSVFVVGNGELKDPTGKLLSQLNSPGTPMFYLIDGSGKILKLWYGYDAADAAGFEKDVMDSAVAPKG